jgi:hypothetical protein
MESGCGGSLLDDQIAPRWVTFRRSVLALTERYSNIAIGKILDLSEAAVRMMLKRAGIRRANRVLSSIDLRQAAIIRAELKSELARKATANGTEITD